MSSIGGIGSSFTSNSSAALQSQLDKLQSQYADCASCTTTPNGIKQSQEAEIGGQIQSVKAEIEKFNSVNTDTKIYQLNNATQQTLQVNASNSSGTLINTMA